MLILHNWVYKQSNNMFLRINTIKINFVAKLISSANTCQQEKAMVFKKELKYPWLVTNWACTSHEAELGLLLREANTPPLNTSCSRHPDYADSWDSFIGALYLVRPRVEDTHFAGSYSVSHAYMFQSEHH